MKICGHLVLCHTSVSESIQLETRMTTQFHQSPRSAFPIGEEDLLSTVRQSDAAATPALQRVYGEGVAFLLRRGLAGCLREVSVLEVLLDATRLIRERQPLTFHELTSLVLECTRQRSARLKPSCRGAIDSPTVTVEQKQRTAMVNQTVRNLPPDEREVLRRTYVLQQTDATIAQGTNLSIEEIQSVRNRCRRLFQACSPDRTAQPAKKTFFDENKLMDA